MTCYLRARANGAVLRFDLVRCTNVFSFCGMCSLTIECVLFLQNVFSFYRMCSLSTECVLLLKNVFSNCRMCSLTIECVLFLQNRFDLVRWLPYALFVCFPCTVLDMCALYVGLAYNTHTTQYTHTHTHTHIHTHRRPTCTDGYTSGAMQATWSSIMLSVCDRCSICLICLLYTYTYRYLHIYIRMQAT